MEVPLANVLLRHSDTGGVHGCIDSQHTALL